MQELSLMEKLKHAAEVLKVREREFVAAQSYLQQAQDAHNRLLQEWATTSGYL